MANVYGIDKLRKHLNTFQFISKLEVTERSKGKAMFVTPVNAEKPADDLISFFDSQLEHETNKYTTYYIHVFVKGPNTKNDHGYELAVFTFQSEERGKPVPVNGPNTGFMQGINQADINNLYHNSGYLQSENQRLVKLVDQLEDEIHDLEKELEEYEQGGKRVGSSTEQLTNEITPLLALIGEFKGMMGQQALPVGGLSNANAEENDLIRQIKMLDGNFVATLRAYLLQCQKIANGETSTEHAQA